MVQRGEAHSKSPLLTNQTHPFESIGVKGHILTLIAMLQTICKSRLMGNLSSTHFGVWDILNSLTCVSFWKKGPSRVPFARQPTHGALIQLSVLRFYA